LQPRQNFTGVGARFTCCDASRSRCQCLSWVNRYTLTVSARLPLFTQLPTYRCLALSDPQGQLRPLEGVGNPSQSPRERPPRFRYPLQPATHASKLYRQATPPPAAAHADKSTRHPAMQAWMSFRPPCTKWYKPDGRALARDVGAAGAGAAITGGAMIGDMIIDTRIGSARSRSFIWRAHCC